MRRDVKRDDIVGTVSCSLLAQIRFNQSRSYSPMQHEGRSYALITIRFKCLACGTYAESSSSNSRDLASCACGAVGIDGGISLGATLNGNPREMEDQSVFQADDGTILPQEVVTAAYRRLLEKLGEKM